MYSNFCSLLSDSERTQFYEWVLTYLDQDWALALSDILRDLSLDGLWNTNNYSEVTIKYLPGKGWRLHTILTLLVTRLQKSESTGRALCKLVGVYLVILTFLGCTTFTHLRERYKRCCKSGQGVHSLTSKCSQIYFVL